MQRPKEDYMNCKALALLFFGMTLAAQEPPPANEPQEPPPAQAPQPAKETPKEPLGFVSKRANFEWDRVIPLDMSVDGLTVKSIFFNKRGIAKGPLRGATFGTRAQVEVVNTSDKQKTTGFAVAVFDDSDNLLGVASGGNTFGTVKSGKTTSFDLGFSQVKERLPRGTYFVVSIELVD
jgi:hypothetical protein